MLKKRKENPPPQSVAHPRFWKQNKIRFLEKWNHETNDNFDFIHFFFQSIREVQTSLRDGVILFRSLLDELRRNMEAERDGIMTTYAKLIDALKKQYEVLIKDLER